MKHKDLIKKLEEIGGEALPGIEIQGHKGRLKMALLNSGYFKEDRIMFWTKRLVPVGVALALILVVGFTIINPQLQIARAEGIAMNDYRVQRLIDEFGAKIENIELINGRAVISLFAQEGEVFIKFTDKEIETGRITRVTVNLDAMSVEYMEIIRIARPTILAAHREKIAPLIEEEEARAIKIAKTAPEVQEMDLEKVEIVVMTGTVAVLLRIGEEGIFTIPETDVERHATVVFRGEKKAIYVAVNLTTGEVRSVRTKTTSSSHPLPGLIEGQIEGREFRMQDLKDEGIVIKVIPAEPLPDETELLYEGEKGVRIYRAPCGKLIVYSPYNVPHGY